MARYIPHWMRVPPQKSKLQLLMEKDYDVVAMVPSMTGYGISTMLMMVVREDILIVVPKVIHAEIEHKTGRRVGVFTPQMLLSRPTLFYGVPEVLWMYARPLVPRLDTEGLHRPESHILWRRK